MGRVISCALYHLIYNHFQTVALNGTVTAGVLLFSVTCISFAAANVKGQVWSVYF